MPRPGRCDAGRPYPFYLAHSWQRPVDEMQATLGPPSNWLVEWKFDGIRAQCIQRGEGLAAVVARRGTHLRALSRTRAAARGLCRRASALDGELVVMPRRRRTRRAPTIRFTASRRSRVCSSGSAARLCSEKTMRELPVAFIAYDLLEHAGGDIRALPQRERRAALESLRQGVFERSRQPRRERLPLRLSPAVAAGLASA